MAVAGMGWDGMRCVCRRWREMGCGLGSEIGVTPGKGKVIVLHGNNGGAASSWPGHLLTVLALV